MQQKKLNRRQRQQHAHTEPKTLGEDATATHSDGENVEHVPDDKFAVNGLSALDNSRTHLVNLPKSIRQPDVDVEERTDSTEPVLNKTNERKFRPIDASRGDNRRSSGSPVHYPSKVTYNLCDVFKDLLNFAAQNLVIGGHLVFWLPVNR